MLRFLEDYLVKKINIARLLNLHGKNMSKEMLMEKTGLSSTSLNRYLSVVRNLYDEHVSPKEDYSSYSFQEVVKELIKSSDNINLLRTLFLYPGNTSSYYKKALNISDASFYRRLAHLRSIIQEFNCDIVVSKGYRIEGPDEVKARLTLAHIAFFFHWDLEEKCTACKKMFRKLDLSNLNYFDVLNGEFEINFFEILFAVSTMRDIQKFNVTDKEGAPVNPFDLSGFLSETYETARQGVSLKMPVYFKRLSQEDLNDSDKLNSFQRVFIKTHFHSLLFPHDSSNIPVRRLAFVDTFRDTVPRLYTRINGLIDQVSSDLGIPFATQRVSLIYLIVSKSLFLFDKASKQKLFVYSDYGKVHLTYLADKLKNFNQFFNNRLLICPVSSTSEIVLGKEDFVASNVSIKSIPSGKQFIINDFFTLSNYIALSEEIIKS